MFALGRVKRKGYTMKKRRAFFQMAVFSALVCFGVSACGGGNNGGNSQSSAKQESIKLKG